MFMKWWGAKPKKLRYSVVIAVTLIIFMSLPVWGQLEKAQDDAETIEEAIARLLDVHNDDSDAHTDTGQSLETHKGQDTIDHPMGSVVADKENLLESKWYTTFESLDHWGTSGNVDSNGWPGIFLFVDTGVADTSQIVSIGASPSGLLDYSENSMFKIESAIGASADKDAWMGIGDNSTPYKDKGYGFRFDGNSLYAYWYNSTGLVETEITGWTTTNVLRYAAIYTSVDKTVRFFVDGEEEASITDSGTPSDITGSVIARLERGGGTDIEFNLYSLLLARGWV